MLRLKQFMNIQTYKRFKFRQCAASIPNLVRQIINSEYILLGHLWSPVTSIFQIKVQTDRLICDFKTIKINIKL